MKCIFGLIFVCCFCSGRAELDYALRTILGISSLQSILPKTPGAKFEVTCFFYEGGKGKRSGDMAMAAGPGDKADLLWRAEANRTTLVLSVGRQTSTGTLPIVLNGTVGGGTDGESVALGDGWIGVSFFTYNKAPPPPPTSVPQTVFSFDKLEKMIKDPARRTLVLAYRLKK